MQRTRLKSILDPADSRARRRITFGGRRRSEIEMAVCDASGRIACSIDPHLTHGQRSTRTQNDSTVTMAVAATPLILLRTCHHFKLASSRASPEKTATFVLSQSLRIQQRQSLTGKSYYLKGLVGQLHQADHRFACPQIPDHDRNQDWTLQLTLDQAKCR